MVFVPVLGIAFGSANAVLAQDQALYAKVRELTAQGQQQLTLGDQKNIPEPVGSCEAYTKADRLFGEAITQFQAFVQTYPTGPQDQMANGLVQLKTMQAASRNKAKDISPVNNRRSKAKRADQRCVGRRISPTVRYKKGDDPGAGVGR